MSEPTALDLHIAESRAVEDLVRRHDVTLYENGKSLVTRVARLEDAEEAHAESLKSIAEKLDRIYVGTISVCVGLFVMIVGGVALYLLSR